MKRGIGVCIIITSLVLFSTPHAERTVYVQQADNPMDQYHSGVERTIPLRDSAYLDTLIDSLMTQHHVPGLAACVVKDGEIIWKGNYGYENIQKNKMVSDSTIFILGSISKTVTSVALMQLWEAGLFDLDGDINDYLSFSVNNPWFPATPITLRMILTHTSSIKDNYTIYFDTLVALGDSLITLQEFCEGYFVPGGAFYDSVGNWYQTAPGTQYQYCNIDFTLAGYLVEAIADTSFVQCTNDSLFDPLSMYEAAWLLADCDTNNLAMQYEWNGSTYTELGHTADILYPAAWLRTSSLQLVRFLTAFMQYGLIDTVRILDSTTVDLMTTVQFPTVAPGVGLGWNKWDYGGRELWGYHGGTSYFGFRNAMYFCSAETSAVVVLTNAYSPTCTNLILNELFDYAAQYGIAETENYFPMPRVVSLCQNYPNPFDHSTTIRFVLPRTARVSLKIYNILGEKVAVLVNGELQAGKHNVVFDAQGLPSGIYFVKFESGEYSATEKLLLIR